HVFYLLNEGYDLKQATTFVGNHLQLSERQRMAVMRSLASREQLAERERKRVELSSLAGREVWIDGFNTIITLEVMLNDSILFRGMDNCIRDLASLRGTYRTIPETAEAARLMIEPLQFADVGLSHILLDRPVSNSGRLKTLLAEIAEQMACELDIQIIDDVDRVLWRKENVITSDAIILDHCLSWVNVLDECTKKHGKKVLQVWC
nr:DUF434 domain-containing protein [Clostridia bacterium]